MIGKGMGSHGPDAFVGAGRRVRESDRCDLSRRRHRGGPAVHRPAYRAGDRRGGRRPGWLNYKSNLQQVAQREYGETPTYLLLDEKGPDHSKCFKISARIGERRFAPAWGRNKKEAEQRAALNALASSLANLSPTSRIDEATVNGSLVTDLGWAPEVWLFLSLLGCVTLFFKFSRFWSVRNLDLLLLFVLVPGMMLMVGNPSQSPLECLYLAVSWVWALAGPCFA